MRTVDRTLARIWHLTSIHGYVWTNQFLVILNEPLERFEILGGFLNITGKVFVALNFIRLFSSFREKTIVTFFPFLETYKNVIFFHFQGELKFEMVKLWSGTNLKTWSLKQNHKRFGWLFTNFCLSLPILRIFFAILDLVKLFFPLENILFPFREKHSKKF